MSEVIDPSTLSVLTAREFQRLISGEGAGSGADVEWEYAKIMASVVCKHGYTIESPQVCYVKKTKQKQGVYDTYVRVWTWTWTWMCVMKSNQAFVCHEVKQTEANQT